MATNEKLIFRIGKSQHEKSPGANQGFFYGKTGAIT
jgi:hypothetical protein